MCIFQCKFAMMTP